MMNWRRTGSAVFLLLFGIVVCFEAGKLNVGRMVRPGPGFFPFWLSIALIATSLGMLIPRKRERVDPTSLSESAWKGRNWGKALLSLVAIVLYSFFLETLGYCIATAGLMFFLFWVVGGQGWVVVISGSLISSLLTYALFRLWLQVQLPVGLWGF